MVFTSYVFLFVFLPTLLLAHQLAPRRHRLAVLTVGSYVFYGWWRADFALLLLFCTVASYLCGLGIAGASGRVRRLYLVLGLISSLGLLAWFKYANFLVANLDFVWRAAGAGGLAWDAVILPVGISFFTFQTASYLIDVHRGDTEPCRSPLTFACYVALFPQLVAGPIVRYQEISADLVAPRRDAAGFARGIHLILIGFNKKVLLADQLAPLADAAFAMPEPGFWDAWIGLVSFSFQIYFDFSAYSDIAVGLGLLLGMRFPLNFDSPYRSESITEFWRRWHMTLSRWLRDYLYVPLGGNRRGPGRTYLNLFLTMLLGGLWHGAQWTFVVWGAYHGVLLALERLLGRRALWSAAPRPVRIALTWGVVTLGWLPFRAPSLESAATLLGALADVGSAASGAWPWTLAQAFQPWLLPVSAATVFAGIHSWALAGRQQGPWRWLQLALFVIAVHEMLLRGVAPFLYFQF